MTTVSRTHLQERKIYILEWCITNYFKCQKERELIESLFCTEIRIRIEYIHQCNGIVLSYMYRDFDIDIDSILCVRVIKHRNQEENQTIVFQTRKGDSVWEWNQIAVLSDFKKIGESNDLQLRFEFLLKEAEENKATESYKNLGLAGHLMNSAFSDVTVKTSEGEEIPAHKVLLVSRSAVFRALFDHDTVEKSTNLVESPFKAIVMKDLLCYIYTDTANNIDKTASRLLVAADYYHLDGLKALCEDELVKKLNKENAVTILNLAIRYHADRLKEKALEFINGCAAEIIKTDAWKSMESVDLAKSIIMKLVK